MYYYVYCIIDPRTNLPIYVGKDSNGRMYTHWQKTLNGNTRENPKLYNKLTRIFVAGYQEPIYQKLFTTNDEQLAYAMEVFWIAVIGRENLCNLTDGGERPPRALKGRTTRKHTEEHKRKIGAAHTGCKSPMFGKRPSEATRFKIRNALKGSRLSAETRAKISRAHLGRWCGENNPSAKLKLEQVLSIRVDVRPCRHIAEDYQIHQSLVAMIKRRERWAHV